MQPLRHSLSLFLSHSHSHSQSFSLSLFYFLATPLHPFLACTVAFSCSCLLLAYRFSLCAYAYATLFSPSFDILLHSVQSVFKVQPTVCLFIFHDFSHSQPRQTPAHTRTHTHLEYSGTFLIIIYG